mgnify:FL=1
MYSCSGLFKGIQKCNSEASVGFLKWTENWGTFIDTMLQMRILREDTRLLYVPVGIKKIVIDPEQHLRDVSKLEAEEPILPVYVHKDCNIVT